MTQQQKEELRKEFGEFLQKNNAGKYFKDGNMIDAYGSCDFIEGFWLSKFDQLIQEKVEKIQKEMPDAWFPGGALELKKRYFETIITILKE